MISPSGKDFIFIHRYYYGKRRFDRLMCSDFKSLSVLIDFEMVSHCCWINNKTLFGYFRVEDKDGYYFYDVDTKNVSECKEINQLTLGDGHPSCYNNLIVFDTYPDKSRMQKLMLYNLLTSKVTPLVELYQSLRFINQTRCDLHPRFSPDGKSLFFDAVYTGKRQHCSIDISELTIQ
jgi:hypothetical protein